MIGCIDGLNNTNNNSIIIKSQNNRRHKTQDYTKNIYFSKKKKKLNTFQTLIKDIRQNLLWEIMSYIGVITFASFSKFDIKHNFYDNWQPIIFNMDNWFKTIVSQ